MQQQPKLLQRICAEGFRQTPYGWSTRVSPADMAAFLIHTLRQATVIVCDDVYSYYVTKWSETPKEESADVIASDCQLLVPPAESYWMEGTKPGATHRQGVLFYAERNEDGDGGWHLWAWAAIAEDGFQVIFPAVGADITITKEGRPDKVLWVGPNKFKDEFGPEESRRIIQYSIHPFLATHSMLSCRQSELEDNDVARKYHKHLDRTFGKRGPDYYRFKTIVIKDKTGTRVPLIERNARGEVCIARHTVIGHPVHYGPAFGKGLLFGKYSGTFIIPPHKRGKREHGQIEKQYVVEPPESPSEPQIAGGTHAA